MYIMLMKRALLCLGRMHLGFGVDRDATHVDGLVNLLFGDVNRQHAVLHRRADVVGVDAGRKREGSFRMHLRRSRPVSGGVFVFGALGAVERQEELVSLQFNVGVLLRNAGSVGNHPPLGFVLDDLEDGQRLVERVNVGDSPHRIRLEPVPRLVRRHWRQSKRARPCHREARRLLGERRQHVVEVATYVIPSGHSYEYATETITTDAEKKTVLTQAPPLKIANERTLRSSRRENEQAMNEANE